MILVVDGWTWVGVGDDAGVVRGTPGLGTVAVVDSFPDVGEIVPLRGRISPTSPASTSAESDEWSVKRSSMVYCGGVTARVWQTGERRRSLTPPTPPRE